jgi:hypothetical protein
MTFRRVAAALAALAVVGCGPSRAVRCHDIHMAEVNFDIWSGADERIEQTVNDSMKAWVRLGLNRRTASGAPAYLTADLIAAEDSLRTRLKRHTKRGGDTMVSMTDDSPPPTPSEVAWYAEHCYNGAPR